MYKDIPFELDGKIISSNEYINKIKDNKFMDHYHYSQKKMTIKIMQIIIIKKINQENVRLIY